MQTRETLVLPLLQATAYKHAATHPPPARATARVAAAAESDVAVTVSSASSQHDDVSLSLPLLHTRAVQLQWCSDVHTLLRAEREQREALQSREYETRYRLTWRAQCTCAAAAMTQRATMLLCRAATQQLREQHARDLAARRALGNDEAAARHALCARETAARVALREGVALLRQRHAMTAVTAAAESAALLSREAHTLHARQVALATRSYRPPAARVLCPHAPTRRPSRNNNNNDSNDEDVAAVHATLRPRCACTASLATADNDGDDAQRRASTTTRTLPWPLLLHLIDDEFAARQRVRAQQTRQQMLLFAVHGMTRVWCDEHAARVTLRRQLHQGACAPRLRALLCIQRWWRLLCRTRGGGGGGGGQCDGGVQWSVCRRRQLRTALCALRQRRCASDWRQRLTRLQRQPPPSSAPPRTLRGHDDQDEVASALSARMACLVTAALSRHRYAQMLDYYAFTLTRRAHDYTQQRCYDVQHSDTTAATTRGDGRSMALLTRWSAVVLYASTRRLPYVAWRRVRWLYMSRAAAAARAALQDDEAAARRALHTREQRDAAGLLCMHTALRRGDAAVQRWLHEVLVVFAHDEASARAVLCADEDTRWRWLQLRVDDATARWAAWRRRCESVCAAEAAARAACVAAEATAYATHIVAASAAPQWRRLYHAYTRAMVCSSSSSSATTNADAQTATTSVSPDCRVLRPSRLSSLDKAAAVVTRCVRRVCAARRVAAAAAAAATSQEQLLRRRCRVLHAQLAQLHSNNNSGHVTEQQQQQQTSHSANDDDGGGGDGDNGVLQPPPLVDIVAAASSATWLSTATQALPSIVTILSQSHNNNDNDNSDAAAVVCAFAMWFDANASRARADEFDDVLHRFRARNALFLGGVALLTRRLREVRARVTDDEAASRLALQRRWHARDVLMHQLVCREARTRAGLVAYEADARRGDLVDGGAAAAVRACVCAAAATHDAARAASLSSLLPSFAGTARLWQRLCRRSNAAPCASVLLPPLSSSSAAATVVATYALPWLSPQQRLCAREDVCRARLVTAHRRWLAETLWSWALTRRHAVATAAREELALRCREVDAAAACAHNAKHSSSSSSSSSATLPLAQVALLRVAEADARATLQTLSLSTTWSAPLLRAHYHYAVRVVWRQFVSAHVQLAGQALYVEQCAPLCAWRRGDGDGDTRDVAALLCALQTREAMVRRRLAYLMEVTLQLCAMHVATAAPTRMTPSH